MKLSDGRGREGALVGRNFARARLRQGRGGDAKKLYRAGDKIHPHDIEELVHAGVKEVDLIDFEHEGVAALVRSS